MAKMNRQSNAVGGVQAAGPPFMASDYQNNRLFREFLADTCGATAVEYGLLAGLVAIGLAGGLGALADLVNLLFEFLGEETAEVTRTMTDN